jgi:uncharacterized protein YabN with tetrapyrrole methylase and pyrophosphatase domain
LTPEAQAAIEDAEKVFHIVDALAALQLADMNASAESLNRFYAPDQGRYTTYSAMADHVLSHVRRGESVCLVTYGHPGVFAFPVREALRRARAQGFETRMVPGISAEDMLFAELGVDPATDGCQSYDATDFLVHRRRIDPTSPLVLWQVAATGKLGSAPGMNKLGVGMLAERLMKTHGRDHLVVLYEAAKHSIAPPRIQRVRLRQLARAALSDATTLFVPPRRRAHLDRSVLKKLGIPHAREVR